MEAITSNLLISYSPEADCGHLTMRKFGDNYHTPQTWISAEWRPCLHSQIIFLEVKAN